MKRYDLRHLGDKFYDRMSELAQSDLSVDEVGIFLFEVGDFSSIQKSADRVREMGYELMNSLKFNEVDWTIVVKKPTANDIEKNINHYKEMLAKQELEAVAKAEEATQSSEEK